MDEQEGTGGGEGEVIAPTVEVSEVRRATALVVKRARALRTAIADLAAARSQTHELTSEDWEAIQEANIALGNVPRPS